MCSPAPESRVASALSPATAACAFLFISSSDSFSMAWGNGTAISASTYAALWLLPFGFQVPSPGVDMGLR